MRSLIVYAAIFAIFLMAAKVTSEETSNVILVVRDLDKDVEYEFCAIEKSRYHHQHNHRHHRHNRRHDSMHTFKFMNMFDSSALAFSCMDTPIQNERVKMRQFNSQAVHIRLDDFYKCNFHQIFNRLKSNNTNMVILGTSDQNIVIVKTKQS